MEPLRVTAGGLQAMASRCQTAAGALATPPPGDAASPGEGSAAAVAECNRRAAVAGEKLMNWIRETAESMDSAANSYQNQDAASADDFDTKIV